MSFRTPVDIANRALQHLGQTRIDPTLGFTEDSKAASEIAFCYDKLRRAELRRNIWTFGCRRAVLRAIDTTTMMVAPALWSSTQTYFPGAIVTDGGGQLFWSTIPDNTGNDPSTGVGWEFYFGPMTASLWDSTGLTSYFAGEITYKYPGDGTYKAYLSLVGSNSVDPAAATLFDPTVTYQKDMVVSYLGTPYLSLINLNLNNTPTLSAPTWSSSTTYAIGNQVAASDGFTYSSLTNGNVGNNPISDGGVHWSNTGVLTAWQNFTGASGSDTDLQINVQLSPMFVVYPLGSGPSSQSNTRNIFRLPAGYLKEAPQSPKAGAASYLGAPSGLQYTDWEHDGPYIVSRQVNPIVYRFVCDISDVTQMDDMFCEGLAARIALEVCEPLTQSTAKKQAIASEYQKFMTDARLVNAIEQGPVEPPVDDWIATRL